MTFAKSFYHIKTDKKRENKFESFEHFLFLCLCVPKMYLDGNKRPCDAYNFQSKSYFSEREREREREYK